ncbi:MAG: Slp family lipoprotein [Pseudomonadota bacterium]
MPRFFPGRLVLVVTAFFIILCAGCGSVISKEVRDQVNPDLAFAEVVKNPENFQGEMVIFSGDIIDSVNTPAGTRLVVLQRPTDQLGRPISGDRSQGRFIALDGRYLDVAIFSPGRQVTVAGVLAAPETWPLGEIQYKYPVLDVKEIYLWHPYPPADFRFGISFQQSF